MKRVGILALQGDFEAHAKSLAEAGAEPVLVRTAAGLEGLDGLVIPGGESTTMLKLLEDEGMMDPLRDFGRRRPIFGTCAGAILLASQVQGPEQKSLALMDMSVERNAYGRQIESCVAGIAPEPELRTRIGCEGDMEAVFIRAPIIRRLGEGARVLARYRGDAVLVEDGLHLAATFHPELTTDRRVHRLFLNKL
ncbi:MAG: pyridoxal 5'-phosphate synthase glutaminase subunit PdxT [Bryobacteraceae bacterium]